MIKIEIKNRWTGKILSEYSKENNTLKDTVIEAVKSGANLDGANLDGAKNIEKAIKVPMHCKWSLGFNGDKISIGCKTKTIKEWDDFFSSDEVYETPRDSKEFAQIQACYEAHKSYYSILNPSK
jgi:hypothetical protein